MTGMDGIVHFRATSLWQRAAMTSIFGLFFLLQTGAYFGRNGTQPGMVAFVSVLLAIFAWLAVRAARSCTLLADDDTITVRGLLRTRRWRWADVDGFDVRIGHVQKLSFYRRRILRLRQRDGNIRWLTELNSGLRAHWVDDAAAALNQRAATRSPDGSLR